MSTNPQTFIDALIDQIDKAIAKGSVTNVQVAAVLDFLNEMQKNALRKNVEDTAQEIITFAKGLTAKERSSFLKGIACDGESIFDSLSAKVAKIENLEVTDTTTTLNLVVQKLAKLYDLDVSHVATLFRTIVKDFVSSEQFVSGFAGSGMKLYRALNGDWNLEIDNVLIRKAMTVFELIISKIRSINGALAISTANGKIKSVTDKDISYCIEIEGDMSFVANDLVRCQSFGTQSKYYWIEVSSVGDNAIIVLKSEFAGVVPMAGDELVQMGNTKNKTRQSLIYLSAAEDGKPHIDILSGINSKSFDGKIKTRLGNLDDIHDANFPADYQPSGDGLYSVNCFLKGIFILINGKTIDGALTELATSFEVREGQISSKVSVATKAAADAGSSASAASSSASSANASATAAGQALSGVTEKKSAIDQTAAGISLSVSEVTKKAADAASSASAASSSASSANASAAAVAQAATRVTEKETSINQTAAAVTISAQRSETAAGKALEAAASVAVNADSIVMKVASSAAEKAVSGVQIGGVNLLKDSAKEVTSKSEYTAIDILYIAKANLGRKVMISFDLRVNKAGNVMVYNLGGYHINTRMDIAATTEYVRYTLPVGEFSYLAGDPNGDICDLSFYGIWGTGIISTVRNVQIELGTIATAYKENAEDFEKRIDGTLTKLETSFEIREGQVSSKVSEATRAASEANTSATNSATNAAAVAQAAIRVTEKETAINQTASAIELKAQEVTRARDSVTAKEAAINQTSSNINLSVSEVTKKASDAASSAAAAQGAAGTAQNAATNASNAANSAQGVLTQITTQKTAIDQTASEVTISANRAESAAGRAAETEARISVNADGIVMKAASSAALKAVSGVQIGGVNLFLDSAFERTSGRHMLLNVFDIFADHIGKNVVVSFDIKVRIPRYIAVYPYQGTGITVKDSSDIDATTTYQRFSYTTQIVSIPIINNYSAGQISLYDYTGDNNITIKNIKIELGTVATPYSPAPREITRYGANLLKGSSKEFTSSSEYTVVDITEVARANLNQPMMISFDIKTNKPGSVHCYALGKYGINTDYRAYTTTEYTRHYMPVGTFIYYPNGDGGVYCDLSFYGQYGSGLISTVRNVQIELGTEASAYMSSPDDNSASITILRDQISSKVSATDYNGQTICSYINQTAGAVKIKAAAIQFEGLVTANAFFKILEDGSMVAVNGTFTGKITATSGYMENINVRNITIWSHGVEVYNTKSVYMRMNEDGLSIGIPTTRTAPFLPRVNGRISICANQQGVGTYGQNGYGYQYRLLMIAEELLTDTSSDFGGAPSGTIYADGNKILRIK